MHWNDKTLEAGFQQEVVLAQVRELQARLEDAASAAARAAREAAAAVKAERAALGEARRENTVLAAAAGADKNNALAELKVGCPLHPFSKWNSV